MVIILKKISLKFLTAFMDLVPIILVVVFFQLFILKVPFPNFFEIVFGLFFVVIGLMLFVEGLEIGLFPVGENLAFALTKKGSLFWLLSFSFLLGFSTTIAEPALIAVAKEAGKMAVEGHLISLENQDDYVLGLRLTVALSVGFAILLGIIRIIKGWPIYYFIIGGYILVILVTLIAPKEIIGIAYDAGGVTTSTITVPLVTALGVGLASVIQGRSPLTDGFGLIAFASLMPMIFVMIYGIIIF
jgi:hypothetical protein